MEINIKKIGTNRGTVGWLAAGLTDGTLVIKEGTLKGNGYHSLWLKGPDGLSQYLAAYNQLDLSPDDYAQANTYETADHGSGDDRHSLWTDASWKSLMTLAQAWCDECNALLDAEEPINIQIVRVYNTLQEVAA